LVVAIDIAGDALRHAGNDVAVLVCDAPAGGEFPCADAALIEGKRVIDLGPGERGIPSTERIDSPVDDPARFHITSDEAEIWSSHIRQLRMGQADIVVLARPAPGSYGS
jgi:hypothetical protein